jgi:hypothetical protein
MHAHNEALAVAALALSILNSLDPHITFALDAGVALVLNRLQLTL